MTLEEFLEDYRKIVNSTDVPQDKLNHFLELIEVMIQSYAKFADNLKRLHFNQERDTKLLCDLRDDIRKKMKENSNDRS